MFIKSFYSENDGIAIEYNNNKYAFYNFVNNTKNNEKPLYIDESSYLSELKYIWTVDNNRDKDYGDYDGCAVGSRAWFKDELSFLNYLLSTDEKKYA